MAVRNIKQVKLQPKYQYLVGGQKIVPWLNISGVWLEVLGFKVGERVRITTRDKLLIIEPLETEVKVEQDYRAVLQQVKHTLKKL